MSSPQHEPTMEEILASIRKIISEDAPEGAAPSAQAPAPAPAAAPVAAVQHEPDILELTQEFVEVSQPVMAAPAPEPMAEPPRPENDVVFESAPKSEAPMSTVHSDIFSDTTRKALDDTFASIPEAAMEHPAPRAAQSLAPVDGATIESVFERAVRESFDPVLVKYLSDNSAAVIERMKPLIREWMDEHFPALLEGAVRAEVERVVLARGAKR